MTILTTMAAETSPGPRPQPQPQPGRAVRSARLSADAKVRNRLFPKTRSWFALEAPLELLSPLSVLRLLFGLGMVVWPIVALVPGRHAVQVPTAGIVLGTVAATWVGLIFVRRVDTLWCHVLFAVITIQIAVLAWSGHGTAVAYAFVLFAVPVSVCAALFLAVRALLGHQLLTVAALAVALAPALGWPTAAAVAFVAGFACLSAALTTTFLIKTAKRQGTFDPDTGLPNGAGLTQRVGAAGGRPSFVVAVVHLKGIDEARQALGYEVGTELLRRAVEDVGQVLPPATFIGRVDGDELVVTSGFVPTDDSATRAGREEEAVTLAETLAGAVNAGRYLVGDIEVSLRSHVGLAVAPWDGVDVPELVRRASVSAGRAATQGKAHVLWGGDFGAMTAGDLALLSQLRLASEREELTLSYQPQIRTVSGRLASVEALLRWRHPTLGDVPPGRFIALAERTGLIGRLTDWVIGEALDAQVRWRAAGFDIPVSINLSPTSLTEPELPDRILAELARRGLPAPCLTVEVTETGAIDMVQAVSLLRPLHDQGVRIAIDDFGAGYTSLAVLPDLPLDELKVDQRFVLRSSTSPADDAIVRTVRALAHRLGLDAVAEGVETGELLERMSTYGFDLLQGYFLSRPLAEPDLVAFARRRAQELAGGRAAAGGAVGGAADDGAPRAARRVRVPNSLVPPR
ncbi:MAG: bifunctional diguanylate cyclase/phosphodiesterase [Acidimicrobiales bacterium]